MTMDVFRAHFPKFSLPEFQRELFSYGICKSWDIEILTSRYFYGMSYEKIADDDGYLGRNTVKRRIEGLHKELVRNGFPRKKTQ